MWTLMFLLVVNQRVVATNEVATFQTEKECSVQAEKLLLTKPVSIDVVYGCVFKLNKRAI